MAKKQKPQKLFIVNKVMSCVVRATDAKEAKKLLEDSNSYDIEDVVSDSTSFEVAGEITSVSELPKGWKNTPPFGNSLYPPQLDDDDNAIPDSQDDMADPFTCQEILKPAKKGKK